MFRTMAVMAMLVLCVTRGDAASGPRPSPMEPPEGTLQLGRFVLVDDGTCPLGQIKKVLAGNMTTTARIRTCIPRR